MVISMTGYGRADYKTGDERVIVEMRSVNHRFFDMNLQLPSTLRPLERDIKQAATSHMKRGKLDVTITVMQSSVQQKQLAVNWPLFYQYVDTATEMMKDEIVEQKISLGQWLFNSEVVTVEEAGEVSEALKASILTAIEQAAEQMSVMRRREGDYLRLDIENRLENVRRYTDMIQEHSPRVKKAYEKRLSARMSEFAGMVDEHRLLTEVAVMAEKSDISEELIRLQSHEEQFRNTLDDHDTIGRKLDFILQEMNRETNTIGSKANDQEVSKLVVEVKAELEKLREQVQNIE